MIFLACVEQSGAGKEGATNYIHMLAAGHIVTYKNTPNRDGRVSMKNLS